MNEDSVDTRDRILWSLRRYWPLLLVLMLIGPLVAVVLGRESDTKYRAQALVVAKSLALRQEQLPRFGEAVFTSGAVADAVAAQMGTDTSIGLIPATISVVPIPDTVLFEVHGTSENAEQSARLANSAAGAFVKELNKAGPGVGVFALQDVAKRPANPLSTSVATPALIVVGILAGLLFGLGIVALLVSVRRPVVSAMEAASIVNAPASASLTLGRSGPENVHGLGRLVRSVFATRTEQCAIVVTPGAHRAGASVATLLAEYVKAPHVLANGSIPSDRRPLVVSAPEMTPGSDVPEALLGADRRVLVVMAGIPERSLRAVARQFGPNEIDGVAFISSGRSGQQQQKKKKKAPEVFSAPRTGPPPKVSAWRGGART